MNEWFETEKFTILNEDSEILNNLKENFDYSTRTFDIETDMVNKIDSHFSEFLKSLTEGENRKSNVGFAVAPYLFTWNFQRFKIYFKKNKFFSLFTYFEELGNFLKKEKEIIGEFRNKKLLSNEINKTEVIQIFKDISDNLNKLGRGQNEPVGTAKLLHIIAPYYFPLIDNPIAEAVKLKNRRVSLTALDYHQWMVRLKEWLQPKTEIIRKIEQDYDSSILKLVDEGFYIMSSINLSLKLEMLGIGLRG